MVSLRQEGKIMSKAKDKKYFILEKEDCEKYLTTTEKNILWEIQKKILASRQVDGKNMRGNYLVIDRNDKKIQEIEALLAEFREELSVFAKGYDK